MRTSGRILHNVTLNDLAGRLQRTLNLLSLNMNWTSSFSTMWVGDDWGRKTGNGSWTGIIRMIRDGQFDLFASSLDMTAERTEGIDYVWPMVRMAEVVVIRYNYN